MDDAMKLDPEYGLGFDPIFNAQDYSESGYKIVKFDTETGIVLVQSKGNDGGEITLKLVSQNGKVLVDGCGAVNMK